MLSDHKIIRVYPLPQAWIPVTFIYNGEVILNRKAWVTREWDDIMGENLK